MSVCRRDVEEVEDVLADLDDAVQDVNEMAELVSNPIDFGNGIDDVIRSLCLIVCAVTLWCAG
jgi:hypothetical protein